VRAQSEGREHVPSYECMAQACGALLERKVVPVGCASARAVGREGTRA